MVKIAFHDFEPLISNHRLTFDYLRRIIGYRNTTTTRFDKGGYEDAVSCEGVLTTNPSSTLERTPDYEHTDEGMMKVITTPGLLNSIVPQPKDKIIFRDGRVFFITSILDRTHYGNYYILTLRKESFRA